MAISQFRFWEPLHNSSHGPHPIPFLLGSGSKGDAVLYNTMGQIFCYVILCYITSHHVSHGLQVWPPASCIQPLAFSLWPPGSTPNQNLPMCVLQDIVPFGAAALHTSQYKKNTSNTHFNQQGKGTAVPYCFLLSI